ncbi:leucine-rich repeat-domain-containing protein [Lipomyces tetrasporus]|uniref:U2 small nuclear ribonucleoprotein A' n=1 Tax=Lipomyces tetrasporus TaxID=54092 RepID=A0AAD7QM10_9ASCO|nr:leucine-rich repeat-domain-containing protein [Lipomyces tetrasporus]KAJ8097714.1 leucine-rich repeat-domain-containing protein [Lipomyces tetrasporus]
MKLTADLINSAPSYINPLKDRELTLRGHKIPVIENLGVTKDLNDAIDLTDNDITHLNNIPRLPRLQRLLIARNRITHISPTIAKSVPNLTTLLLTSNSISNLSDLEGLKELKQLTYLSLVNNPITRREHYRLWVIWRLPSVRILDYEKVRQVERQEATKLFGTFDDPTPLATKLSTTVAKARTFEVEGTNGNETNRAKLTAADRERIMEQLRNAKSLGEIERLEQTLRTLERS